MGLGNRGMAFEMLINLSIERNVSKKGSGACPST
ncbi:recombinase RecU [Bacillus cereus]|nr:recombinase RecU [Bacillus cereus]